MICLSIKIFDKFAFYLKVEAFNDEITFFLDRSQSSHKKTIDNNEFYLMKVGTKCDQFKMLFKQFVKISNGFTQTHNINWKIQ